MGKGDKKTRKGKVSKGSFGVSRPRENNAKKIEATPVKKSK
jgi:30S ribosomal protein S31